MADSFLDGEKFSRPPQPEPSQGPVRRGVAGSDMRIQLPDYRTPQMKGIVETAQVQEHDPTNLNQHWKNVAARRGFNPVMEPTGIIPV